MAKWVCSVCGYVHEGDTAPEVCPICKAPAEKFTKQDDEMAWRFCGLSFCRGHRLSDFVSALEGSFE